jgi:hypothetical protein
VTVALFGDSHAAHWLPALTVLAERHGWRVKTFVKSACSPGIPPSVAVDREGCWEWRVNVLSRLAALQPDMVFMAARAEVYDFDSLPATRATIKQLAPARAIYIRGNPTPPFNALECLSRVVWRSSGGDCTFDRDAAVARNGWELELPAHVVDLTHAICPEVRCSATLGSVVMLRDQTHLTASFSASLADALDSQLALVSPE